MNKKSKKGNILPVRAYEDLKENEISMIENIIRYYLKWYIKKTDKKNNNS